MSTSDYTAATRILSDSSIPSELKMEKLLPVVYEELRRLAAIHMGGERANHTLQPTALAHEAFLRLVGNPDRAYHDRRHFFNAAGQAMRRILIEHARRKNATKRGGDRMRVPLDSLDSLAAKAAPDQILALDSAFQRLEKEDGIAAEVMRLRLYAGLTADQVAEATGVSRRTVLREWQYARAVIFRQLTKERSDDRPHDPGPPDTGAPSDHGP